MPELFPYQIEGARFLAGQRAALLADTMGLGKSAQAVVAAATVLNEDRRATFRDRLIVICPASLVENWNREIKMWWPPVARPSAYVMSYDRLARNPTVYDRMEKDRVVVILDEAHYLKNPKAKRTKAVLGPKMNRIGGVVENADYVWALTGTPAPNNPSELWPLLHALNPGLLIPEGKTYYLPMGLDEFTARFCVVERRRFTIRKRPREIKRDVDVITGGKCLDELKRRISPFVLRRRKDEVLADLPEIRFGELPLRGSTKAVAEALGGPEADEVRKILDAHGVEGLKKLAHSKQRDVLDGSTLRRLTALAKAPLVAEWAKEWLNDCDDKLVIFGQHREALAALADALNAHDPAVVHGAVGQAGRQAAVDRFQGDPACRVFIGQIQAAGTGITLTAASDMIFLEQSWTPSDNAQAAMRIHRIGQNRGCLVRVATLPGSIDEAVQRTLARKTESIVALFDAVA